MSRQKLLEKFEQFVNKKTQQMRRVLDLDNVHQRHTRRSDGVCAIKSA